MKPAISAVAVAVALALTMTATGAWYSGGDHEPDNALDTASMMWQDPPGALKDRVYFNAYPLTAWDPDGHGVNPNLGALHTRWSPTGNLHFEAHFGIWVDCNRDGYIGLAETAAREYRNELLTDKSLCQPTSSTSPNPPANWNRHNHNGWVTELIPIGRGAVGGDKRIHVDHEAKVWGDFGVPYPTGPEFDQDDGSTTCPVYPFPRGTFGSTGGLVDHADCYTGHALGKRYNQLVQAAGLHHLALDNASSWNQPGHALNVGTFGSKRADDALVHAQDCSRTPVVTVGQLTRNTPAERATRDFATYGARPPSTSFNTGGSVAGTYNATEEALRSDCDASNDDQGDFYGTLGEGDAVENSAARKRAADFNFNFSTMSRGGAPLFGLGSLGRAGGPSDGGIEVLEGTRVAPQSEWNAVAVVAAWHPEPWSGALVRGSLSGTLDGDDPLRPGDARLPPASWFSFYAYAGGATTSAGYQTPTGGVYGAPFCPTGFGTGAGTHYGWECERALWYVLENGEPEAEPYPYARPGDPHQFRDVDCFDGGVTLGTQQYNAGETGTEPAFYGTEACRSPPSSTAR